MITLYPTKKTIIRKSFKDVKKMVVPNQSMSLREIVRRFIRREPLPVSHEGTYETRFGDLEKIAKLDMVEQHEIIDHLKTQVSNGVKREKEKQRQAAIPPPPTPPTNSSQTAPPLA